MTQTPQKALTQADSTLALVTEVMEKLTVKAEAVQEKVARTEALVTKALAVIDALDSSEQRLLLLLEKRIKTLEQEETEEKTSMLIR